MDKFFKHKDLERIFDFSINDQTLYYKANKGVIPAFIKFKPKNNREYKGWSIKSLPEIGREFGFLKDTETKEQFFGETPGVILVFTTKGGVLKTSLAFNIARIAALNGVKTCVVGLDSQGDISMLLDKDNPIEDIETVQELIELMRNTKGIDQLFNENQIEESLSKLIMKTDLPTLDYIPETEGLESLNENISSISYREEWLLEHVVSPLKLRFGYELIVIDSSPTTGRLVQNAIKCADLIVSPLECSIQNFRNYKFFRAKLEKYCRDLRKSRIPIMHIPTKLQNRKLSREIYEFYIQNVTGCIPEYVPFVSAGEDACLDKVSILEFDAMSKLAINMREIVRKVCHQAFREALLNKGEGFQVDSVGKGLGLNEDRKKSDSGEVLVVQ